MIDFAEEYTLTEQDEYEDEYEEEEYEEEYEDDPLAEAVYMTMIEYYRQYFDEGPPVMQMRGGPFQQARLMLKAIERGSPIAGDEICWPSDPETLI